VYTAAAQKRSARLNQVAKNPANRFTQKIERSVVRVQVANHEDALSEAPYEPAASIFRKNLARPLRGCCIPRSVRRWIAKSI